MSDDYSLCYVHIVVLHVHMYLMQGSVIGGFLAQPASKFGPLKIPFFCEYPYSLPCIVGASLAVVSFIGKVCHLYTCTCVSKEL